MSPAMVLIIVVVVLAVIVRRFRGVPLSAGDLFGPPVILVAIGLWGLREVALSMADLGWLIATSAVGFLLGALRGTTPALFSHAGALWQRYRFSTLVVWVLALAIHAGISILRVGLGMPAAAGPMTLSIGVGVAGEVVTLGLRALSTGVPFSPEKINSESHDLSYVDQFVAAARARRPVAAPENRELRYSPTLGDGIAWLRGRKGADECR